MLNRDSVRVLGSGLEPTTTRMPMDDILSISIRFLLRLFLKSESNSNSAVISVTSCLPNGSAALLQASEQGRYIEKILLCIYAVSGA